MCIYIYVYAFTCIYIYMYISLSLYIYIYIYMYKFISLGTRCLFVELRLLPRLQLGLLQVRIHLSCHEMFSLPGEYLEVQGSYNQVTTADINHTSRPFK